MIIFVRWLLFVSYLKVCKIFYGSVAHSCKASFEKASVQNKKILLVCNRFNMKKVFVFSKTN